MLKFYGFMCCFYFLLATLWFIFSALYWKDLLRIQFWVGAVILLGMLEKACFYFEFHQTNEYGQASLSLGLIAEIVSDLESAFSTTGLEKDVRAFMGFALEKQWLEIRE